MVGIPALLIATLVAMAAVEAWVRWTWDERRGSPGFYVSDPVLGQRLAPGYDGWFAGVPVRINQLGFRDNREYALDKPPGVFRILVLGDSVTFGHGTSFETTYPYLLETRLREWRPDVNWQVWNLGVPGYNTTQELQQLLEWGARAAPDLVIVGFYPNDLSANTRFTEPTLIDRARSRVQGVMQRYLYSYEFYKRALLTLRWRLLTDAADRARLEALSGDEQLLARQDLATAVEQQLTDVEYFDDDAVKNFICDPAAAAPDPKRDRLRDRVMADTPELAAWRESVAALQRLHREGRYRIVFFINMAPTPCTDKDRFHDYGALEDDDALRAVLGAGVPVASSTRAFLHYRPSQMPGAGGHAIGNANRVKADVLFNALRAEVLPPLLPAAR